MRQKILGAALGVAVLAAGSRAGAYEVITVTDGGSLSGTVKYAGTPPEVPKIEVTKDNEVCGTEKVDPRLLVGSGGGIQEVAVVVKAAKGKALRAGRVARGARTATRPPRRRATRTPTATTPDAAARSTPRQTSDQSQMTAPSAMSSPRWPRPAR